MTHKGWMPIYRRLQDHWLWQDKPFAKGQAWLDLLLLASHNDKEFLFGNQIVKNEVGSFITSELKLAERWGWGRKKVRLFLELLQNEQMIAKKGDNRKTTITIVNYSIYADYEIAKEQQKNIKGTSEEHQRNTINNDNNYNNENNKEKNIKKESRHKYGMYQNVLLSDVDLEKLKTEFPNDWDRRIERLSEYIASTGKSYKNHLATIRVWARKDKPQKQANNQKSDLEGVF
jgi:hypothetical protein